NRRPRMVEVRDRLACDTHRQVWDELPDPGSGGHDDDLGVDVVERLDAPPDFEVRTPDVEERLTRDVRADHSCVRLRQRNPSLRQLDAPLTPLVSRPRLRRRPQPLSRDVLPQHADSLDLDLDDVARTKWTVAADAVCGDHVAGKKPRAELDVIEERVPVHTAAGELVRRDD